MMPAHGCTSVQHICARRRLGDRVSDYDQLVQASRLYYELGETQNAIAERLGVTRPQVSRLLKRARAEGIVEIRIVDRTAVESPAARRPAPALTASMPSTSPRPSAGPEDLTRRMVGRLAAQVLRADDPRRGDRRDRRRRDRSRAVADALDEAATPVRGHGRARWPAATGRPARSASRSAASPRRSAPRPTASWRRGCSTTPRPSTRSRRTPASAPSSTCGTASMSRSSGSAAGRGARHRSATRSPRELDARRRRRRDPHRPVRPRRRRSSARRCASGCSRSMPGRSGGSRSRSGSAAGREQGPADPRRAAGRRRSGRS